MSVLVCDSDTDLHSPYPQMVTQYCVSSSSIIMITVPQTDFPAVS